MLTKLLFYIFPVIRAPEVHLDQDYQDFAAESMLALQGLSGPFHCWAVAEFLPIRQASQGM